MFYLLLFLSEAPLPCILLIIREGTYFSVCLALLFGYWTD
jgi:hypothetical protein